MRDQHELALQCLEVEKKGENVIEYLKSLGFYSPKATWERLQLNELGRKPGKYNGGIQTMKRMTLEFKKELIQAALDKKDPLVKLRMAGFKDARSTWYQFKKRLKDEDPETYAKIQEMAQKPSRKTHKKEPETATVEVAGPVEVDRPTQKITKLLMHSGLKAVGWGGEFGRYIHDEKNGFLDVYMIGGELVSLRIEEWQRFLKELKDAALLMGVEL